jgi:outer membrane immunogenic protein
MRFIPASLLAVSFSLGVVSGASAADMPVKSPYVGAPPAFSWSGFYVGVHAGYNWSSNNWTSGGVVEDPTPGSLLVTPMKPKTDGILGGVQAGANYQIASWVVGMEADWAFLSRKGSSDGALLQNGAPPFGGFTITSTATSKIDWLAQFTGRAGYAFDRTLFYVKGGVAAGGTKDNFTLTQVQLGQSLFIDFGTKNNTLVGWTAGGGIEHFFSPNWSAKIEYNYVDLGSTSENFNFVVSPSSLTFRENIEHKLQIVKVGGNYKF